MDERICVYKMRYSKYLEKFDFMKVEGKYRAIKPLLIIHALIVIHGNFTILNGIVYIMAIQRRIISMSDIQK